MAKKSTTRLTTRIPAVIAKAPGTVGIVVAAAAENIKDGAEENIQSQGLVDSGELLGSVEVVDQGPLAKAVVVNAFWGEFHELGTESLPAKPFLGPAADAERPAFKAAMGAAIKRAAK
ncbi:MAG TPA: hypothetical protein VEW67_04020 [Thermoleophilaceae bacterium]|nr:hypothetical protein [Thermoleophilaceae bacterium]